MCAFPSCPVFPGPTMPSLLIVEMMLKCTGCLLIRLSCSVTGRINQSRGRLGTYIFQAHLRTSGYEITVLSSQIWSTNAVPLCHSNLRWRCYYVELGKVIKTVQQRLEKPGWTFLTAFIYPGSQGPFFQDYKSSLDLKKIKLPVHRWPPNIAFPHLKRQASRKKQHIFVHNIGGKNPLLRGHYLRHESMHEFSLSCYIIIYDSCLFNLCYYYIPLLFDIC